MNEESLYERIETLEKALRALVDATWQHHATSHCDSKHLADQASRALDVVDRIP